MSNGIDVRTREKRPKQPKQSQHLRTALLAIIAVTAFFIVASPGTGLLPDPETEPVPSEVLPTFPPPEQSSAESLLDPPHEGKDLAVPVEEALGVIDPQTGVVNAPLRTIAKEAVQQVVVLSNPEAMFPASVNVGEDPESNFIEAFISGDEDTMIYAGRSLQNLGMANAMSSYLVEVARIRMHPDDIQWFSRTYSALANGLGRKDLADSLAQEYAEHLAETYFSPERAVSEPVEEVEVREPSAIQEAVPDVISSVVKADPPEPPANEALRQAGLEIEAAPLEDQAAVAFNPTPGKILEQLRQLWMLLQSQSPGGQIQHVIGAYQKSYAFFGMQYLILAADPATEWDGSEAWAGTDGAGRAWWRIGVVWKHQPPGFALGDSFNPKTLAQTISDLPFVP